MFVQKQRKELKVFLAKKVKQKIQNKKEKKEKQTKRTIQA